MAETTSPPNGDPADGSTKTEAAHKKFWPLRPEEIRLLGTANLTLAAVAAIVQILGTSGGSPARSMGLAAVTLVAGAVVIITGSRFIRHKGRKVQVNVALLSGLLVLACAAGGLLGLTGWL